MTANRNSARPSSRRFAAPVRLHLILTIAAMLLGISCSAERQGVKIVFLPTWNGQPIACEGEAPALTDLRFYISNIELAGEGGRAQPLVLDNQLQWQQQDLALIDLENGRGSCSNGTAETYAYLVGSVPPGGYRGLRFTVGVPFERNHANPLTAEQPLDDPAMHWHWRSGYKFLRAGIKTETDGFWIHVGSAGCEGTVRNISGCRFPNRVTVELADFVPRENTVAVDLSALMAGTNLEDGEAGDCSSGPPELACVAPFEALGIDFRSGDASGRQRVFSIAP